MHEGVDHAIGDLARRQRIGHHRIQHGEARLHQRREEVLLVAAAFTGDHRAAVGFGAGGRQRQHAAHRHRVGDVAADGLQDMPGVAVGGITGGGGDELGAVNHRPAADRQQEIDVFRLHHLDRFHQRFVGWVRLDAGELPHVAAGQRAIHLIQHAVFFTLPPP